MATHMMGRFIRSKKVWIQGLPMDMGQIIGLIRILRENYHLPISDCSKEALCEMIATNQRCAAAEKGSKGINTIGSTSAVAAFVFELDKSINFTAVIDSDKITVSEIVIDAQVAVRSVQKSKKNALMTEVKEVQLTWIVIPWYIEVVAEHEVKLVLRFLNFSMDAKSEIVHCILQEISTG